MHASPVIFSGKTTLAQTAALIKKCDFFVSNDSGLLHVASAIGTPAIGIYGPTNPARTGPYPDSRHLVRKDLDCSPCYSGKPVRCGHLDCIRLVRVEDVIKKIEELFSQHDRQT